MPNSNLPVTVHVNFVQGVPNWVVTPAVAIVNHGDIDTLQWTLQTGNLPTGAASAAFAQTDPIQFVTIKGGNTGDAWTGPTPTRVSDTLVQVSDDNTTQTGTKTYYYSINISTLNAQGQVIAGFTYDPEVENPGG